MECYEGATMIKTFRGLLADASQDTIVLHTNDGSTGYRVVKFQAIGNEPGEQHQEHVLKIYKVDQNPPSGSLIDNTVDFSEGTLLGVVYIGDNVDQSYPFFTTVIFDSETFNQDIYVTHVDTVGSQPCNYYIELEQVKLDLNESTVATLKNLKNLEPGAPVPP